MSFIKSIGFMRNPPDRMSEFYVGSMIPLIVLNLNISREVVDSVPIRPLLPIRYRLNALATSYLRNRGVFKSARCHSTPENCLFVVI